VDSDQEVVNKELSLSGRDMALFPLEPALSRMILASIHHDCADDMVSSIKFGRDCLSCGLDCLIVVLTVLFVVLTVLFVVLTVLFVPNSLAGPASCT